MYKICKTEKSMERQRLFQTTLLSMMKKIKYQDITVTALCKEMEIPRKTFYRYFDTLEDVLTLIIDDTLTEAFLNLEVKADLEGFFTYWKKRKPLLDVLEKSGMSSVLVNHLYLRLENGRLREEPSDNEMKYAGYVAALMTMLVTWHHAGMKRTPEEMSDLVKEIFRMDD